jgi:hypothetical protein
MAFAILRKQASSSWEVLVSYVLDKSLLPRTLRLVLGELGIEFSMCLATDLRVCRSPISVPLIGIIESAFCQFQNCRSVRRKRILKAFIRVYGSSRVDDIGRRRFTHTAM